MSEQSQTSNEPIQKAEDNIQLQNNISVEELESALNLLEKDFLNLNKQIQENLQQQTNNNVELSQIFKEQSKEYIEQTNQVNQKLERLINQCEMLIRSFPDIEQLIQKVSQFKEKIQLIERLKEQQLSMLK